MNQYTECPYCGHMNEKKEQYEEDMKSCGKTVMCCERCDKLYVLRDDGDGEYIKTRC